ncbi:phosphatases II [Auricularia subglabra TFB-10046 SS5]|nr:phosphatases II [Auricularia subglabra TFB-10046 SS5]
MRERMGRPRLVGALKKLTLSLDQDALANVGVAASCADSALCGNGMPAGGWSHRSDSVSSTASTSTTSASTSSSPDGPDAAAWPAMSSRQALSSSLGHAPSWLHNGHSRRFVAQALDVLDHRDAIRQRAMAQGARRRRSGSASSISSLDAELAAGLPEELTSYYACADGLAPENQRKNRYCDILPFDRTRVRAPYLKGTAHGPADSRYLNANFVRELAGGKYWIATQAALPFTAHALLSLLLQPVELPTGTSQQVRTIVQLTVSHESGRVKAHPYFPDAVGQTMHLAPEPTTGAMPQITITLLAQREYQDADAVVSTLRISAPGTADHVFNHLLYTAWPDHGVPAQHGSLVRFVRLVDKLNRDPRAVHTAFPPAPLPLLASKDPNAFPPTIVGCSAGVGRTGAFIAISSLLRAFGLLDDESRPAQTPGFKPPGLPASPLGPMPQDFQKDLVIAEVDALREQRSRMVQTYGQLVFVYDAVASAFQ